MAVACFVRAHLNLAKFFVAFVDQLGKAVFLQIAIAEDVFVTHLDQRYLDNPMHAVAALGAGSQWRLLHFLHQFETIGTIVATLFGANGLIDIEWHINPLSPGAA